jgi:ribosomal protein L37E
MVDEKAKNEDKKTFIGNTFTFQILPAGPLMTEPFTVQISNVEVRYCPRCGRRVESDWNYCPYCGFDLKSVKRFEYKDVVVSNE